MSDRAPVSVIGTGTWGTAVAVLISRAHPDWQVQLWGRDADKVAALQKRRLHPRFNDQPLPAGVTVTNEAAALAGSRMLFWAVPTQHTRALVRHLAPQLPVDTPLVSLSKGLEQDSMLRVSEIFVDELDHRCCGCLSGPSHAEEVIHGLPCALAAAGPEALVAACVEALHGGGIRIYAATDLIGVELGGALKNVIAIAAGIADGLQLGDNAKAALVTRGLAEIRRLGRVLGACDSTFAGLTGIGDLLTTCYSPHGRNRALGQAIAAGESLQAHLQRSGMVAEGAWTARVAVALADRHGIELPIAAQVASMLWNGKPVRDAISDLLSRAHKEEAA